MVAVTGTLTARTYEDSNGNKRTQYEIVSDTVEIVGGKKTETSTVEQLPQYSAPSAQYQQAFNQQGFETVYESEDLPF